MTLSRKSAMYVAGVLLTAASLIDMASQQMLSLTVDAKSNWTTEALGGPAVSTPRAAVVQAPMCPPITVINGTLGQGSPDYPFTTGQQTGRILNGLGNVNCGSSNPCTLNTTTGSRTFDAYFFTNPGSTTACVTVNFTMTGCNLGQAMQFSARLGSFNPANPCENYVGDGGAGFSGEADQSFSFNVPAGETFIVVVNENDPGGATGCAYTLTVSGVPDCVSSTCVNDMQAPSITCPANITKTAGSQCNAVATYTASASDNCPGVTVSCSPASGSTFPLGTTTVTCKATDAAGNMTTCTFTVTVTNAAPSANAGPDKSVDEGALVTLNGSGNDPDAGQSLTFQWTQTGGPAMTLNGANTATATFTAPSIAAATCVMLTFQLKVTDPCGVMATDTVVVKVSDVFVLQDDRNGHCLRLNLCAGTYTFKTSGNGTFTGPVVITINGSTINFQSGPGDANQLQGGADLGRRTGNARLNVPRGGARVFTIADSNTTNNGSCP